MELFHASTTTYLVGQKINVGVPSIYYPNATAQLDFACPPTSTKRSNALFASDSEEFCIYYLIKQGVPLSNINLYCIDTINATKCPFAITHALESKISKNGNTQALIKEYWKPTLSWLFFEYLTPSFTIKNVLALPNINQTILSYQYGNDFQLASSL